MDTNARQLLRRFIEDKIREIAYERYVSRTKPGSELEDWLQAESEVLNRFRDVRDVWSRLDPPELSPGPSKIAS